ncbi:hypothetical protein IW146_008370 [Coemansia sp. RSA 922]|nr:hypothetical protein GGH13_006573 [Coemansia sp. S155-1]KAJ2080886.1 hypothetical protein GGI09_007694 [Coemansia sp. S100]KAJ2105116.1 hypothetical protein IW146_008370 [Coemansia sp. RSA 922]
MAWVFVPCILVRVLLWSIHIFGLFGLLRMFAGIKLLWLVAGKVLTAITIQFDDFNPFDEPDNPEPLVTSRFLRQLYFNYNNSSVPRTGGITHTPDDEADDDGSDDDVDNAGADVNLPEERTQAVDTSSDTILPEQRALDDAGVDNVGNAEDAEQDPPSNDMADGDSDAEDTEQRAQVDNAGSQPEETSATDAPIQDAALVNGTGALHVVESPPAVIEMEAVNLPVDGDLEERPPVADFDMADAGPPADDDLDMGDEDSASDDDVQIEAFAQVLEAAKIEAKMEELRRPHKQPRLRRPVNAAAAPLPIGTFKFEASPLPPTPVSPASGTFNAGSFSLGNTGRDQFRGNPGAPLHQVNADDDGSSDDDEFDELANDIEAGLKNDACIPADNSDAGGNGQAGGEQAANKQDDSAQVDSTQTDKAQVQKVQTESEWDDREQEYSEQPDDEQIDYEKVENVLRLYNSLSRFEQDWLMDQALSGNQAAYTAPAATGATAFSFNRVSVSAEDVLGLYNGLSDEERLELVDIMAPEE